MMRFGQVRQKSAPRVLAFHRVASKKLAEREFPAAASDGKAFAGKERSTIDHEVSGRDAVARRTRKGTGTLPWPHPIRFNSASDFDRDRVGGFRGRRAAT
jgi:hypothetical protein